jgi:hypothetical protein
MPILARAALVVWACLVGRAEGAGGATSAQPTPRLQPDDTCAVPRVAPAAATHEPSRSPPPTELDTAAFVSEISTTLQPFEYELTSDARNHKTLPFFSGNPSPPTRVFSSAEGNANNMRDMVCLAGNFAANTDGPYVDVRYVPQMVTGEHDLDTGVKTTAVQEPQQRARTVKIHGMKRSSASVSPLPLLLTGKPDHDTTFCDDENPPSRSTARSASCARRTTVNTFCPDDGSAFGSERHLPSVQLKLKPDHDMMSCGDEQSDVHVHDTIDAFCPDDQLNLKPDHDIMSCGEEQSDVQVHDTIDVFCMDDGSAFGSAWHLPCVQLKLKPDHDMMSCDDEQSDVQVRDTIDVFCVEDGSAFGSAWHLPCGQHNP